MNTLTGNAHAKVKYYLDANATSRLRPGVERAMLRYLKEFPAANPSSIHHSGRRGRAALQQSKEMIARYLSSETYCVSSEQVIFTSGGTEACNAMIHGFLAPVFREGKNPHVVVSAIEHPAILRPLECFRKQGAEITLVKPGDEGVVPVQDFKAAIKPQTALVLLMGANNETGVVQPVSEVASSLRSQGYAGAICSDATQLPGKFSLRIGDLLANGVNAIALSAHKWGVPAGAGLLCLNLCGPKQSLPAPSHCSFNGSFEAFIWGGSQENSLRAGTENLLGIISWGEVVEEFLDSEVECIERMAGLRNLLWQKIQESLADCSAIGMGPQSGVPLLANTLMVRFPGCSAKDLVVALDLEGVAVSSGSACSSGKQHSSHVLLAMGMSDKEASEYIRFSLDWDADQSLIEQVVPVVAQVVERMRRIG